jgi:hypothetical protein
MRIRVLRLPPQVEDALVGVPYVMLLDRLGEGVPNPETVEHLRQQLGARAVFADAEDIELEDLGADELEYDKLMAAMQIAAGDTDESDLNVL